MSVIHDINAVERWLRMI